MGKDITIKDFTNSELDYLIEMIHEKILDMGHKPHNGFSFDVIVHFDEEEDQEDHWDTTSEWMKELLTEEEDCVKEEENINGK